MYTERTYEVTIGGASHNKLTEEQLQALIWAQIGTFASVESLKIQQVD